MEGLKAVQLLPYSKDAVYSLTHEVDLAHIYTLIGDHDRALGELSKLLDEPSWISSTMLKIDPRWRPLINDHRFENGIEP